MGYKIETAPRFAEDVTIEQVVGGWLAKLQTAKVVRPRKQGEPYLTLRVDEAEYAAFRRLLAELAADHSEFATAILAEMKQAK